MGDRFIWKIFPPFFKKAENCHDFQFEFMYTEPLWKLVFSQRKNISFTVHPYWRWCQNNFDRADSTANAFIPVSACVSDKIRFFVFIYPLSMCNNSSSSPTQPTKLYQMHNLAIAKSTSYLTSWGEVIMRKMILPPLSTVVYSKEKKLAPYVANSLLNRANPIHVLN